MIFRDGWYYLLVTHGSCCAGTSSSYNIRMGRSRKVTGPFLDNMGIDMRQGGGKLFRRIERPQPRFIGEDGNPVKGFTTRLTAEDTTR